MSKFQMSATSAEGLPRKLTAVGTIGDVNQLFTVYEKNWNCTDCGQENYAQRPRCSRCKKSKPANANNYVMDPAFEALQAGKEIQWQEVVDPNTFQVYYYNKVTGVTQWDRPDELGPAPLATGWFGRGRGGAISQLYDAMNKFYLTRPARQQKDFLDPKKYHTEGAQEYNIWYGRFSGDFGDKMDREPATDRCKLENDAGFTRADGSVTVNEQGETILIPPVDATKRGKKFFCLHFARGMCCKGANCIFYHRIPLPADDAAVDELFDCFGRPRHNKHKDDMSGVGSFMKPCRTLFVGNLQKTKYTTPKDLEDALWRHFGEWGELESLNVIHRLSIAFPRYRLRTSAEFAKESMSCQALEHAEVLSIRWAHDDPNPVAKDSIQRADADAMVALLRAKGISLTPAAYDYPPDYQLPNSKRLKTDEGAAYTEANPEIAYPDTDAQYAAYYEYMNNLNNAAAEGAAASSSAAAGQSIPWEGYQSTADDKKSALERLGLLGDYTEAATTKEEAADANKTADEEQQEGEGEEEGGWEKFADETTGAIYYFNTATGESSWTTPEGFQEK